MPTGDTIYNVPSIVQSICYEFSHLILIITLEGRHDCDYCSINEETEALSV